MVDFSSLQKKAKVTPRLPRVIMLPPSAWADHRTDKPREPVAIGIRLISEEDVQIARATAARIAVELVTVGGEDDRVAAYNDALCRVAAASGTCAPHDSEQAHFPLGELEIRERLTPEGVRRLYQEVEALHIASNPSLPEIDDEGLAHLFALLDRNAIDALPREEALRVRRLLELCRSELAEVDPLEATG